MGSLFLERQVCYHPKAYIHPFSLLALLSVLPEESVTVILKALDIKEEDIEWKVYSSVGRAMAWHTIIERSKSCSLSSWGFPTWI